MLHYKDEELLFRQIHPNFITESRVTSQAFLPTAKDNKKLSVNRNTLTSAKEAFDLHTQKKNLQSIIVRGARQVGKTHVVQEFGHNVSRASAPTREYSLCPVLSPIPVIAAD